MQRINHLNLVQENALKEMMNQKEDIIIVKLNSCDYSHS